MIKLGSKVTDVVTGLSGIAIGRCEYLTGCIQYGVQPQEIKDGKPAISSWIDEDRLKVETKGAVKIPNTAHGGPQDSPTPRSIPSQSRKR